MRRFRLVMTIFIAFQLALAALCSAADVMQAGARDGPLLVVGSLNLDSTVHLDRLPQRGETMMSRSMSASLAVGGKGANQAVASARLSRGTARPPPRFVCRMGGDSHGSWLQSQLSTAGVDLSGSLTVQHLASGQGIVWLDAEGAATSVVLGGANAEGWPGTH